ncbi:MAG TPA: hypothetical protein VI895_11455 [Bdellovibrionota bacterium]|nr:hypothetical protein [Bdellovibrionota bacterium]
MKKDDSSKKPREPERKPYVKPKLERMNEKVPVVTGAPPVPGAPAAATASPVAPGATVF